MWLEGSSDKDLVDTLRKPQSKCLIQFSIPDSLDFDHRVVW